MTTKPLTILALLLLNSFWVFGDDYCDFMSPSDTTHWGQGVLWLTNDTILDLNNGVKGQTIESVYRVKQHLHFNLAYNDCRLEIINQYDLVRIGNPTIAFLKVYEIKNSKNYLILKQSVAGGVWVTKSELVKANAKYFTYKQLLFTNTNPIPEEVERGISIAKIGVNFRGICLNLRLKPTINSEKILCIKCYDKRNNSLNRLKIKNFKGKWALVEVTFFEFAPSPNDGPDSCTVKAISKKTGWVKAIADNGYPNIWFSTHWL